MLYNTTEPEARHQVLGFVLLVSFAFFERYFAKIPFIPFKLLTSRTIFATLMLDATVQIACVLSLISSYTTSLTFAVYTLVTTAGMITTQVSCR